MATKSFDSKYKYGFATPEKSVFKSKKGLSKKVVLEISGLKREPDWMRDFRLKSYKIFEQKQMPGWGGDLSGINFQDIVYFVRATKDPAGSWEELPKEIKETYEKIGLPEAERKRLSAGTAAQFDSEVVYESLQKELTRQGVIFCDMDTAVKKYPEIVKRYFGTLVPAADNKFAALNSAAWSGGSFVYVPKNVKVALPLQAYFRINAQSFGQFERTLIIAEENGSVEYQEGCSAPIYNKNSLHAAVVEIFVKKNANCRYVTVQNWSKNVYNLVTKRAKVEDNGLMRWLDVNVGSHLTMKYPSCYLVGQGAKGEMLSIAFAGKNQHQDAGAKMFHFADKTSSRIISKSISKDGGRTSYRGSVQVLPRVKETSSFVSCNALILDEKSRSDTYPLIKVGARETNIQHEATVEKIGEEKLFYLSSRGIKKEEAESLLVNGFIEPVAKEIPFEYAVELNRLMNLEMSGTVG